MSTDATAPPRHRRTAMEVLRELRQPKVAVTLALGFSSGLPFLLTANTLGYWLREEGTSLQAIGFMSWVGLAYTFKWLWSPVVDRVDLPLFGRLGRRRGWMAFAQLLVAAGLVGIAVVGPKGPGGLTAIGAFALLAAFASATQDIVIDAWRIEAASNSDEQGLLSSAAALGYRAAIIAADALILAVAARIGWPSAYLAYGAAMGIGLAATWFAFEPARAEAALKAQAPLWNARGFFDAVVGPFVDFFAQHKALGFLMLAAIATYRLPDFVMGPMYTAYYVDLGLTKNAVAAVRGSFGLFGALAGVAAGGLSAARLGLFPTLIAGALLQGLGTAAFALLALYPGSVPVFSAVMGGDNFVQGYAGVALIAYMSSLTSLGYTATQYALLSSAYALLGKFLKGFSGTVVEGLAKTHGQMPAYEIAFVGAGLIALPAMMLFLILARLNPKVAKPI
jgi:PAT family beta-lactamase induction signal transducer AmpG